MKNKILPIILAMSLVFALAGCGTKTNTEEVQTQTVAENSNSEASATGNNFDTGDSTIMDGTNNPDTSEDETDYPLGNDESIPDGGAEATAGNLEGYGTRNPDGTYTWQVGNYQLTTKINVLDYIDINTHVWRVNDMATALGWDKNKSMAAKKPLSFDMDDTNDAHISFSDGSDHCGAIIIKGNNFNKPISLALPAKQSNDYTFNDKDFTISFEGIVCFAYACEQLSDNSSSDPFAGQLNIAGGIYDYIN